VNIRVKSLRLRPRFSLATAAGTPGEENILLCVRDGDVEGYGEIVPYPPRGETAASLTAQIRRVDVCELFQKAASSGAPGDVFETRLGDEPSLLSGVEMAWIDLVGKTKGICARRLLGLHTPVSVATSYTLHIAERNAIHERLAAARAFSTLKIKVGFDGDVALLRLVRDQTDQVLWVDANGGWVAQVAPRRIEDMAKLGVTLIEQPIPAGQRKALAELVRHSPLPVIVDEDITTGEDLRELAGCVHGVNLKLAKCGGISRTLNLAARARELGLQVMIGCMFETSLGVGAAAQIADCADHVDLDGHLFLRDDPFEGLHLHDGRLVPSTLPGWGITPHPRTRRTAAAAQVFT
jgi:L-alanine-DL-glutamate epimerase-like enolase superfamily enzyme